jgi:hypothetical protein
MMSRFAMVAGLVVVLTGGLLAAQWLGQAGSWSRHVPDGDGVRSSGDAGSTASTAAQLRAALVKGGTIRLAPGRYDGNFVVSVDGTTLIGVADLPLRRVAPGDVAAVTLAPADRFAPTLQVTASRVAVSGLTVLNGAADRETVVVGSQRATRAEDQPDDVMFDRVAVLAGDRGGLRGFSLHTRAVTVRRSHVAGFWYRGRDSQGIWANNGPGPYTIDDNYVEGSGENILFGGASIRIRDCVPSDVRITNNTIAKPEAWRSLRGSVKNSVEFKAVRRALVEHNLIDGNWRDAQAGDTILLTPRNQEGDTPWVEVTDVTIRGNRVQRARDGYAITILGTDDVASSRQTARVTIEHNLFVDARGGVKVTGGVADALVVRRNTFPAIASNWFLFSGEGPLTPLTVEGNVARSGAYGISGDRTTVGVPSLQRFTKVVAFRGNVIERTDERRVEWPRGNTLLDPGSLTRLLDSTTFKHPDGTIGY